MSRFQKIAVVSVLGLFLIGVLVPSLSLGNTTNSGSTQVVGSEAAPLMWDSTSPGYDRTILNANEKPLSLPTAFFTENQGQLNDDQIRYYSTTASSQIAFTSSGLLIDMYRASTDDIGQGLINGFRI